VRPRTVSASVPATRHAARFDRAAVLAAGRGLAIDDIERGLQRIMWSASAFSNLLADELSLRSDPIWPIYHG
jgi:hypothetical protein